jgi:hypothetical protein
MKQKVISLAVLLFMLNFFPRDALSQKVMKLNDSLKTNSEPLSVKTRGGSMMKFDFGVYKTVSAKSGWTTTKSKSKLFSSVERSESRQKSSVVITGNEPDTATINISLNIQSEEVRQMVLSFSKDRVAWERDEDPSKIKQTKNLVALITTNRDTAVWNFIYVSWESANGNETLAFVTDGNKRFDIKKVTVWDNGKSPALYSVVGFEFYADSVAVAAVQNPMDTFQKKFVWLKNDLDEYMKLILATASSVLFSFTNQLPD